MKSICITASGGGHTGYAVALAQRLQGMSTLTFIVPEGDEWSKFKVERYGDVVCVRKARGPRDSLISAIPRLIVASLQSLSRVSRDCDVLVSTGSNHSVPPAIAAKLKGLKVVNVESSVRFTRASVSARVLRPISDLTVLQWSEQEEILPGGVVVGPIYEKPEYEVEDAGYVLVTGGTYGYKALFDVVDRTGLKAVVLQTGKVNPSPYKKRHPEWIVFDFDPDFSRWIARASVVISHLGKTVIDAALTYKKPVVIVPNPEWRLTAGLRDAEILAEKLNAVLVEEVTPRAISKAIDEAKGRRPPDYPDGAEALAKILLKELA